MEIGIISIHNLKAWIIWSYIKAKKINSNNPLSSFLKGLSTCQQRFEESFLFPQLGRFVPSCKKSGGFQEMQCHFSTGYCWCVDSYGKEQLGTRTRGKPNCTLPGKKETSTCNFWKNYRDICRHQFAHTLLSIPVMPGGSCMSFICYWRDQGYFGSLPPPKTFNQIVQTYCSAHFWM